jgi:RNA polymerase sigma factor (sigma-70 family)
MSNAAQVGHAPQDRARARRERHDPIAQLADNDEAELRRRLARWAGRFLGLPEAEFGDAYQDAWRKLLESRSRGRPVRNLEHALRWSIHNCWLEECRRRRRHPTVPVDECAANAFRDQTGPDPAEQIERLEAARYLFRAARAVDELSWQVVLLRDIWGLSPTEVCDTLGISGRTYRSKHARALMAIYSQLATALADQECTDRNQALRAVAAGTATSVQRHEVERHTRHCASCRRALGALARSSPSAHPRSRDSARTGRLVLMPGRPNAGGQHRWPMEAPDTRKAQRYGRCGPSTHVIGSCRTEHVVAP